MVGCFDLVAGLLQSVINVRMSKVRLGYSVGKSCLIALVIGKRVLDCGQTKSLTAC